jgi:hypothetical protein
LQPIAGIRVIKFNTLLRVVYTLGLSLVLSPFASAQSVVPQGSVLNFVKATVDQQSNAGFSVMNPTSNYADVQFTFYGLDGNPIVSSTQNPNLVNPVRYRVAPKGQVSMSARDLFAATTVDGWVQVTSPTPGLTGSYLLGDFSSTLEGAKPAAAVTTQVIPLIRQDSSNDTQLVIVNSMTSTGTVTIELHAPGGQVLGAAVNRSLAAHSSLRLEASDIVSNLPADNVSARITSTVNMSASAVINRGGVSMFVPGQRVDQQATLRVAPHFTTYGYDPTLVLTNPTNSTIQGTVTLFGPNGGAVDPSLNAPSVMPFSIPPFGSVSKSSTELVGRAFFGVPVDGWLRVDSPNTALDGLLVLDRGQSFTAEALESSPQPRLLFSEIFENQSALTGLALINPASVAVTADLFLVQLSGTTVEHSTVTIAALSKFSKDIGDVLPDAVNQNGNYVVVQSSSPLYGVAMVYGAASSFIASVSPARVPSSYAPANLASVFTVDSGTDVQSGQMIQVSLNQNDVTFTVGGQVINNPAHAPGIPTFLLTLPALEPGFVTLKATSNGIDSPPVLLHVWDNGATQTQTVSGTALYQKFDVTDSGLDLNHAVMFPIRNARVEVVDPSSQAVVSVSETDDRGQFKLAVPPIQNLTVRVLSRIRSFALQVADNTNQGFLYTALVNGVDGRSSSSGLLLVDTSRISGAFNILEVVQRANETVKSADPTLPPTPVTIYWSTKNTNRLGNPALGLIGTSEFNVSDGTAYILGDRNVDSDEYDDAVIAHEYAHMLAAKYSRDDSPGGPHSLGDMLDPRVSWSEGWANFFSAAVRNDPFWRDSMGPNGSQVLKYDLGDSTPAGDPHPGYWSEASVDTLLWGLYKGLDNDNVQYSFPAIWAAFTALKNDRFVYLPYFLDNFISNNSSATADVVGVAQARSIFYLPNTVPSVTNPFPLPINVGVTIGPDTIDSLTTKRTNLITSSHFYTFTTTGGATTIRMDITNLGSGKNPEANDLDIFLYNANGQMIDKSDSGGNGQPERMADRLGAGAYVVEVRSYYTNGGTGAMVFNSGDYTLSVSVQ